MQLSQLAITAGALQQLGHHNPDCNAAFALAKEINMAATRAALQIQSRLASSLVGHPGQT